MCLLTSKKSPRVTKKGDEFLQGSDRRVHATERLLSVVDFFFFSYLPLKKMPAADRVATCV